MDFLSAAFDLTRWGWQIFPLATGEKIPAGGRGVKDATDDEEVIATWARRNPRANIGLACGKVSGICVIDLDPRNGSDESIARLAARKQTFPPTVSVRTANGGYHLYYRFQPDLKNSANSLAKGIDFKTCGGYVVAPPSVLTGGRAYAWTNSPLGGDLPRLPQWAVEAMKPKPKPVMVFNRDAAPKDIKPLVDFVANAGAGNRNNYLFWAACKAAEGGLLDNAAEASFLSAALACGLDKIESEKTIDSAKSRKKLA
jgi:hypothetical protein